MFVAVSEVGDLHRGTTASIKGAPGVILRPVAAFWTIMVFAFVLGMAALGGFVFFYWFMVAPFSGDH